MKTVTIAEGFTGYPAGKRREFVKGEEVEVADAFADLITGKGHAREPAPAAPEPAAKGAAKQEKKP